jgi:hypothetical protein
MSVKKLLLSTLIISYIFLNDCTSHKKEVINIKTNAKENTIQPNKNLENKISLNSPKIVMETANNNAYLLYNIKNRSNLQSEEYLKNKISQFIKYSEHVYVEKDTDNTIFYKVQELTLGQLQRIYLMYEYLNDTACLQEMGKIIDDDVADKYAEHGGIVLFDKKKINFKTFESYETRIPGHNRFYGPPEATFTTPSIAKFHLHAEDYDEGDSANPSSIDFILSDGITDLDNEAHDFLITPLKRGTFNVDYYGRDISQKFFTKALDLGNFSYDTTSIK